MFPEFIKKSIKSHYRYLLLLIFTWGFFLTFIFSKMIVLKKEGIFLGHPNVWSDWSLHIGIANIFAYKNPQFWFSYHPLFTGGKFTYPFVMDLISGLMQRMGIPLDLAFFLPSVFFVFLLILSMYFLFFQLTKSRPTSILGISIYFFSSGLGFLGFIQDFLKTPNIDLILHPIREYSRLNDYQWYTGNVIVGLIIPQRSFLMGMSLGLLCISLLIYVLNEKTNTKWNKKILIFCGVLAGLLPIIHPHSFIVTVIVGCLLTLFHIKTIRLLLFFVVPAGIISSFLYIKFLLGGIQNPSFFTILPGWTSHGIPDFFYMWVMLWGMAIPLSITSFIFYFKKASKSIKAFFYSIFIIFIIANIVVFQPIVWDNTKLFWWAYVGISILCSLGIVKLFQKNFAYKIVALTLAVSLMLTGVLELTKLLDFSHNTYMATSADDIKLGREIRSSTSPLDLFATAPKHNTLVMMWAARPILLGYTAWVLNFGFNYHQREQDLYTIYQGGEDSQRLIKEYGIKYLLIGPTEISDMHANEEYFLSNFPVSFSNETNKVFNTTANR